MPSQFFNVLTLLLVFCCLMLLAQGFGAQAGHNGGQRSVRQENLKETLRDVCYMATQRCEQENTLPEGRATQPALSKRKPEKYVELEKVIDDLCTFASRHC